MQQADLFQTEPGITAGQLERQRKIDLARSEQVKAETMAVYKAHPGEFIWTNAQLRAIKHKYDLGAYFNDTIHTLHREGKLESRNVYPGATSPVGAADLAGSRRLKKGEKPPLPYQGFSVEYRAKEEA